MAMASIAAFILRCAPKNTVRRVKLPGGQGINLVQGVFHIAVEKRRCDRRMPHDYIVIGPIGGLQRVAADLENHAGLLAFEIRQPLFVHADMTVEAVFIGLRVAHLASQILGVLKMKTIIAIGTETL